MEESNKQLKSGNNRDSDLEVDRHSRVTVVTMLLSELRTIQYLITTTNVGSLLVLFCSVQS